MKRTLTLLTVIFLVSMMHIVPVMAASNQGLEWGVDPGVSIDYMLIVDADDITFDGGIYVEYNATALAPTIPDSIANWSEIPYFDMDFFYANDTSMGFIAIILIAAYNIQVPIGNWTFLSELAEDTINVANFVLDDEDPYFWGYSWEDDDWEYASEGLRITVHVDFLKIDGCLAHYTMSAVNITTEESTGELTLERMDIEQYTDRTDPTLNHPADIEYILGATGNSINWTLSDEHPVEYQVRLNGSLVKVGYWNSTSEQVTILVDALDVGVHNYTITITDIAGNTGTDEVFVTVVLVPEPLIPTWGLLALAGAAVILVVVVVIRKRR
jgi:hypothetical protein